MNTQLVESLTQIINTLTPEEKALLNQKMSLTSENQEQPFYQTATPAQRAKAFQEWAENHRQETIE
jgi:Spy/CpxP family protein refolding chaperone